MKDNNKVRKILSISSILFIVMLLVSGSSYAYWTWQSASGSDTEVNFTVTQDFSCSADGGGNITEQDTYIVPTSCTNLTHTIKREIKVKPTIYDDNPISMDLWLDINELDSGLSNSQNFKYALTTSSTSCTDGVVKMGNFNGKDKEQDNKISLLNFVNYTQTTEEIYYLYIWLDKAETSTTTMNQNFSLSLNGSCTSAPEPQTYIVYDTTDNTLSIYKRDEEELSPMNNTSNKSNVFMPKYIDDLYNVDKIENDNNYFDLENKSYTETQLPWYEYREDIKRVIFEDEISPISMSSWFSGMTNVEYIDVSKINISKVTYMGSVFRGVAGNVDSFRIVGFDKWNTSSVTTMNRMFAYAGQNATTFDIGDLSNWDVSSVTNMGSMFNSAGQNATTWNIGDLSEWDVSKVTDMDSIFNSAGQNATTWNIGDLSEWDVSKVTDMDSMFKSVGQNATTWNIGNLSEWDVSSVTSMSEMFRSEGQNATTWNIGDLSSWDVSNVSNMSMFAFAGQNATTFDIGDLSEWDVSSVTSMGAMFAFTGKSATTWNVGDLSSWDVSSVTSMGEMFRSAGQNATTWNIGNISSWNVSSVTNMNRMFREAGMSASNWSLDLSGWNVGLVTDYTNFNINVELKVTPPVWVN